MLVLPCSEAAEHCEQFLRQAAMESPLPEIFQNGWNKHLPKLLPRSEPAQGWGGGWGHLPEPLSSLLSITPNIWNAPQYTKGSFSLGFCEAFLFSLFCNPPGTPFHSLSLQPFKNINTSWNSFSAPYQKLLFKHSVCSVAHINVAHISHSDTLAALLIQTPRLGSLCVIFFFPSSCFQPLGKEICS